MAEPGFCRDCLTDAGAGPRCTACGSPRLFRHKEVDLLSVAHVDCDAFFAAVEKRDDPNLRDKPVIVGGGRRGVVSTCCYIARISGVRSAMPMFKALKLCPDAVVVKPDHTKYSAVGREVRTLMRNLTPLVEPVSIDEAFLDLTGTERVHAMSPARALARFAKKGRGRDRDHGLRRHRAQQVPGQDRIRPRQAARLRGHRAGGRRRVPRRQAGRHPARRRRRGPRAAGSRRHPHRRRHPPCRSQGVRASARRARASSVAAGAR